MFLTNCSYSLFSFYLERNPPGWLTWPKTLSVYKPPDSIKSTFQPWDSASAAAIEAVRKLATDPTFWKALSTYYSEENHEESITQDNVSVVKSLCKVIYHIIFIEMTHFIVVQLLEDEPFEALRPQLEKLIADKDQNKQRAAAEFLAGIIGGVCIRSEASMIIPMFFCIQGSKHWPINKQDKLWAWFTPFIKTIFNQNIKTDTLSIWTSFLEVRRLGKYLMIDAADTILF